MNHYSPMRRGLGRNLLAVCAAMTIAGCSVALFPEKQSQRVFTLPYGYTPASAENQDGSALPALQVVRPQASGVLNGKRIVIETRPSELAAYEGVRWMTEAPVLLRDHLVRALREDPRMASVVSDTSGSGSDITLTSNLLAFQETRSGPPPSIELFLQAQLVENGSRRILATRDFKIRVPAGSDIRSVVAGFGAASDQLAAELADWVVAELADY